MGGLGHLVELASAGVVLGREIPPAEDERLELDDVHQDIGVETLVAGRFFESSVIKLFLFECCRMQSIAFGRLPSVAIDCVRLLLAKSIPHPQAGGKAAPLEMVVRVGFCRMLCYNRDMKNILVIAVAALLAGCFTSSTSNCVEYPAIRGVSAWDICLHSAD